MFIKLILFFSFLYPTIVLASQAQSKILFVPEGKDSYQGIFTVTTRADYPYPIKTDRINQIMGRRLATYNAMQRMSQEVVLLNPYLSPDFQAKVEGFFVHNVCLSEWKTLTNEVLVSLEYLFICNKSQYAEIKKNLKNKFHFELQKKDYRSSNQKKDFIRISHSHWTKLVHFHLRMTDDS